MTRALKAIKRAIKGARMCQPAGFRRVDGLILMSVYNKPEPELELVPALVLVLDNAFCNLVFGISPNGLLSSL